jgi:hypothetical protein
MFDPAGALEPETKLDRQQAAAALTARGYKTTASTLATLASRGGGPLFSKFRSHVVYRWSDLLEWAESKLTRTVRSTSELDVHLHESLGGAVASARTMNEEGAK